MTVKTIGLDLAKDVFQVHGISENALKTSERILAELCEEAEVEIRRLFQWV